MNANDQFITFTADVNLDFSQFQITGGRDPKDRNRTDGSSSVGLARSSAAGQVWFVALQQYGRIPVEVAISTARPEVDTGWDEVIELPFICTGATVLQGYDESMGTHSLPLEARKNYRLRYSISNVNIEIPWAEELPYPPAQRYRVQIWPSDVSPAMVLVSETKWGQFSQFTFALEQLANPVSRLDEGLRIDAYVDGAIAAYPGGREDIVDQESFVSEISRHLWALKVPTPSATDFSVLVDDRLAR